MPIIMTSVRFVGGDDVDLETLSWLVGRQPTSAWRRHALTTGANVSGLERHFHDRTFWEADSERVSAYEYAAQSARVIRPSLPRAEELGGPLHTHHAHRGSSPLGGLVDGEFRSGISRRTC